MKRSWKFQSFYVVQHKEGNPAQELGQLASSLGYTQWYKILGFSLVAFLLGGAVSEYMHYQEIKQLKQELFSAQVGYLSSKVKK
jgi:hypothetical protein